MDRVLSLVCGRVCARPFTIIHKNFSVKSCEVDSNLVNHLEHLALVDFRTQEAVERLNDAIKFADQLMHVDVENVKPMVSPIEDRVLYLRDDVVTDGNCRNLILRNAKKTLEEYFVAPPGNIPLRNITQDSDVH